MREHYIERQRKGRRELIISKKSKHGTKVRKMLPKKGNNPPSEVPLSFYYAHSIGRKSNPIDEIYAFCFYFTPCCRLFFISTMP